MKLIHYGSNSFEPAKFEKISCERFFNKPRGGLWSSPINSERSWYDWCIGEDFRIDRLTKSFTFSLKDARVLIINCIEDLAFLPTKDLDFSDKFIKPCINFEKVADEYDAIHLTENGLASTHYFSFTDSRRLPDMYGWDCETVLVLNKSVIVPD